MRWTSELSVFGGRSVRAILQHVIRGQPLVQRKILNQAT